MGFLWFEKKKKKQTKKHNDPAEHMRTGCRLPRFEFFNLTHLSHL